MNTEHGMTDTLVHKTEVNERMNPDTKRDDLGVPGTEDALLDRLQLIREQPLSQRAASLNQLHQHLSQLVE